MGSRETQCSQVTRLKPFKPLKLAPHEAVCSWSCLLMKLSAHEAVFQRKSSAHEANNLIPFEELPLKVFDPYSEIYFIAGLRHYGTSHCWTTPHSAHNRPFKKIFSQARQKDAWTRSIYLSILFHVLWCNSSNFAFLVPRLLADAAVPGSARSPPPCLALHSHKAAIICKLVLSARPLHYG